MKSFRKPLNLFTRASKFLGHLRHTFQSHIHWKSFVKIDTKYIRKKQKNCLLLIYWALVKTSCIHDKKRTEFFCCSFSVQLLRSYACNHLTKEQETIVREKTLMRGCPWHGIASHWLIKIKVRLWICMECRGNSDLSQFFKCTIEPAQQHASSWKPIYFG